jgi:RNA polymerase sigma factor (TIGR02999 family)
MGYELPSNLYEELRKLARRKISTEPAGLTLQPTELVHEVYLRMRRSMAGRVETRSQFLFAAAEAMRRILIEHARRKKSLKRGGTLNKRPLETDEIPSWERETDFEALDEAVTALSGIDPAAADVVKLRFFAGLTLAEAAEALDISPRTADRHWAYARAWLRCQMG